jgi:hypothetical protein
MALDRIHERLLARRAWPQRPARAADGQHLAPQLPLLLSPARVQRRQGALQVDGPDRLPGFPDGAQQLNQGGRPLDLGRPPLDLQVESAQNE